MIPDQVRGDMGGWVAEAHPIARSLFASQRGGLCFDEQGPRCVVVHAWGEKTKQLSDKLTM